MSARVLVVLLVAPALAGDLDPPGGAVSETMKTLVEVEPRTIINAANTPGDADSIFRITAPGSYYLVANITVITAESAIEIAADDVTIDLSGFVIRAIGIGTLDGISATEPSSRNIHIRNGAIHGFGDSGIGINNVQNCMIDGVRVSDCGADGIRVTGASCRFIDCIASGNGNVGLWAAATGSVITGCIASSNALNGIDAGVNSVITDCTAYGNTDAESYGYGISCGSGSVVSRCAAWQNSAEGIRASNHCVV